MGVLAEVAATIAGVESNIDEVEVRYRDSETSSLIFRLGVRDRQHLASVLRSVRAMSSVLKVSRDCA